MDNKKNGIPKLRFPGFTGAWEQRKFFDNIEKVIDFRGRTPKKLGMKWSNEGYVALSALNVKDGYIDFTADVHYANKDLYDKWMVGNDLYKGQVLFTTEAPMGNVAQIPDNQKYVLSQRTIAFDVFRNKITNDFLAVLLRSQNVQHKLKSLASGGTAQGVSQKSLSQLKVTVPTRINEQQKIGEFFKQLDSLIALHQRKLEHLQEQKKGLLQKMFPKNGETVPEVRFPGFTDAWEQRKLGEILKERKERSSIGELISVTINNGVVKADSLERKDNSSSDKSNYKVVCKGDIAYNSMRMWQGASGYSPYNGILSPAYTVLIPTEKVDSKFISYMFKKEKMLQQFQKYSQGLTSDTWNLKYPMLKDIPVLFPKIDEQVSIRKHLDNISSLITLHQRKLDHLELMKKGLLQQMFV